MNTFAALRTLGLTLALLALGPLTSRAAGGSDQPDQREADSPVLTWSPTKVVRFQVTGRPQTDELKAFNDALGLARDRIVAALRELRPDLSFSRLRLSDVEKFVVRSSTPSEYHKPPVDRVMYVTTLHLELHEKDQIELLQLIRLEQADMRQSMILKPYAFLVLGLLTLAGYFRLEERTKGYYTMFLRAGAVVLLLLAAAGLWYWTHPGTVLLP